MQVEKVRFRGRLVLIAHGWLEPVLLILPKLVIVTDRGSRVATLAAVARALAPPR